MRTRSSVDQLAGYPDAIAGFANASFENIPDPQISSHLLDIDSSTLERETRVPSDYEKLFVSRKGGNDLLNHPIRKILLLRITAHILERKDSDRRLVGEREWLLGVRMRVNTPDATNPKVTHRFRSVHAPGRSMFLSFARPDRRTRPGLCRERS
jgi:hypothetical protein